MIQGTKMASKTATDVEKYSIYQQFKSEQGLENVYATIDDLKTIICKLQGYLNFIKSQPGISDSKKELLYGLAVNDLPPIIQFIMKMYEPEMFVKRCSHAIAVNKFRPKDLSLLDLVVHPDLFHIRGQFSTFSRDLTDARTQSKTPDEIRSLIVSKISNMTEVSEILTKEFIKAIETRSGFQRRLIASSKPDRLLWGQFLQEVASEITKKLGVKQEVFVCCVQEWGAGAGVPEDCLGNYFLAGNTKLSMIVLNLNNLSCVASRKGGEGFFIRFRMFVEVCVAFLHEFSHFLDDRCPDCSALGAQKSFVAKRYYDSNSNVYYDNPTEVSAHIVGNLLRKKMMERCFGD